VKNSGFRLDDLKRSIESREDLAQQKAEPTDEAEVVAGGGEDGVGGVPLAEPEIVAAHAVLGLEITDDGFDCGPAAQFALDPGRYPTLLAGDEDSEAVVGDRGIPCRRGCAR
jgi:hypothetical protein